MTIEDLRYLQESGAFHHATIRGSGSLWDGLAVYRRDPNGHRGFTLAGFVLRGSSDFAAALERVRGTGISLGSYGNG